MGQVTIYLDDETEARMRAAVRDGKVSLSKWVAGLIREKTAGEWPASVAALAGAWRDFPSLDEIRGSAVADTPRERI